MPIWNGLSFLNIGYFYDQHILLRFSRKCVFFKKLNIKSGSCKGLVCSSLFVLGLILIWIIQEKKYKSFRIMNFSFMGESLFLICSDSIMIWIWKSTNKYVLHKQSSVFYLLNLKTKKGPRPFLSIHNNLQILDNFMFNKIEVFRINKLCLSSRYMQWCGNRRICT